MSGESPKMSQATKEILLKVRKMVPPMLEKFHKGTICQSLVPSLTIPIVKENAFRGSSWLCKTAFWITEEGRTVDIRCSQLMGYPRCRPLTDQS